MFIVFILLLAQGVLQAEIHLVGRGLQASNGRGASCFNGAVRPGAMQTLPTTWGGELNFPAVACIRYCYLCTALNKDFMANPNFYFGVVRTDKTLAQSNLFSNCLQGTMYVGYEMVVASNLPDIKYYASVYQQLEVCGTNMCNAVNAAKLCPTDAPTPQPTDQADPTFAPLAVPTPEPTVLPAPKPTPKPVALPTKRPSSYPTKHPTKHPTRLPTRQPVYVPLTTHPSRLFTPNPSTRLPTTRMPTNTVASTRVPSWSTLRPSVRPTGARTSAPTTMVRTTGGPTRTVSSTHSPTASIVASSNPTQDPTDNPTKEPSNDPTKEPSNAPSQGTPMVATVAPSATESLPPSHPPHGRPLSPPNVHQPPRGTPAPSVEYAAPSEAPSLPLYTACSQSCPPPPIPECSFFQVCGRACYCGLYPGSPSASPTLRPTINTFVMRWNGRPTQPTSSQQHSRRPHLSISTPAPSSSLTTAPTPRPVPAAPKALRPSLQPSVDASPSPFLSRAPTPTLGDGSKPSGQDTSKKSDSSSGSSTTYASSSSAMVIGVVVSVLALLMFFACMCLYRFRWVHKKTVYEKWTEHILVGGNISDVLARRRQEIFQAPATRRQEFFQAPADARGARNSLSSKDMSQVYDFRTRGPVFVTHITTPPTPIHTTRPSQNYRSRSLSPGTLGVSLPSARLIPSRTGVRQSQKGWTVSDGWTDPSL